MNTPTTVTESKGAGRNEVHAADELSEGGF
jgi:hypothetical protein